MAFVEHCLKHCLHASTVSKINTNILSINLLCFFSIIQTQTEEEVQQEVTVIEDSQNEVGSQGLYERVLEHFAEYVNLIVC